MSSFSLPRTFWDIVRPLHAPLTRRLRQRFGRNYEEHPEMELPPPFEALGLEVERHLDCYLHVNAETIERIVIVGANAGDEIPRMRRSYPRSRFLCFEPSPRWFPRLNANYGRLEYVECRELALGKEAGTATFHELPMEGNGSLLQPDVERWARFVHSDDKQVTSYDVQVSTLNAEAAHWEKIDLLWVDVQGAEGQVLAGGMETLKRVSAVYLEVWLTESAYEGGPLFAEINALMQNEGFSCVGLGIDGWNFTGNALWIRDIAGKTCRR